MLLLHDVVQFNNLHDMVVGYECECCRELGISQFRDNGLQMLDVMRQDCNH